MIMKKRNQNNYFDELQVTMVRELAGLTGSEVQTRDFLRIGLMSGTEVTRISGSRRITAKCPFIFFNFSGIGYRWETPENCPRNSFFFDIRGTRAESIERMLKQDFPTGIFEIRNGTSFRRQLEQLSENFFSCPEHFSFRLPLLAEEFLAMIYREVHSTSGSGKYEQQIMADAEAVKSSPGGKYDFTARAAALGITPIHYRRIFKSITGYPPYGYMQKCRLLLAIKLLRQEKSMKINEIAAYCGFMNSTEFSRFFRKQTGVSPSEYFRDFSE